jgi:class 3 adenylate cyclase
MARLHGRQHRRQFLQGSPALAGPGEVLVSSTVKDLVAGSGIQFTDRGAHTLKGIPDEWRLFAVKREESAASVTNDAKP